MIKLVAYKSLLLLLVTSILVSAGAESSSASRGKAEDAVTEMQQQLVSFLESGQAVADIPRLHPLYPLKRVPALATTTCLLFYNDPAMLSRIYPRLNSLVLESFDTGKTADNGLIPGGSCPGYDAEIFLSPAVNALSALELHSLSIIASRIGKYYDAIELHGWYLQYAGLITGFFYDHSHDCFFPVSGDMHYMIRYAPEQLFPLLVDRSISGKVCCRIADRLIYNMSRGNLSRGAPGTLWNEPLFRKFVLSLLSGIDGISLHRLEDMAVTSPYFEQEEVHKTDRPWIDLWSSGYLSGRKIFPEWSTISSLLNLSALLDEESLLPQGQRELLAGDIEEVKQALSEKSMDIERFTRSIATANGLLARISSFTDQLKTGDRLWKIVAEERWKSLSPRSRKLVIEAGERSLEELMDAKVAFSTAMMEETGIRAEVVLPDKPVPAGRKIPLDASIYSEKSPFEMERLYLQVAGNRWPVTGNGEKISLEAGGTPFTWSKSLALPPGTEPGIIELPAFFDFMHEGKRLEIHAKETITITNGFDVSLNFPAGRRLDLYKLPLHIVVKYKADEKIGGKVEGVFLEDLECSPLLPARFEIDRGSEITILPIEISPKRHLSPGDYPFSISVSLEGRIIAAFEDKLVRPIRWLHLGPMPNAEWIDDSALSYQDDLFETYIGDGGQKIRWSKVPAGAVDQAGSVLPDRLYGTDGGRSAILYTVLVSPVQVKARWTLETGNSSSIWINSMPISIGRDPGTCSGTVILRKGRNSILLVTGWQLSPSSVDLSVSDENGYPISGISNEIDEIFEGYANLAGMNGSEEQRSFADDRPREVTFRIEDIDASEISLIGEFNNWDPDATPMTRYEGSVWTVTLILRPGDYPYKFLVDRKRKIVDPKSADREPDGFGGLNSVLHIR